MFLFPNCQIQQLDQWPYGSSYDAVSTPLRCQKSYRNLMESANLFLLPKWKYNSLKLKINLKFIVFILKLPQNVQT